MQSDGEKKSAKKSEKKRSREEKTCVGGDDNDDVNGIMVTKAVPAKRPRLVDTTSAAATPRGCTHLRPHAHVHRTLASTPHRQLRKFDVESMHTFYRDESYVYKTFSARKAERVAEWLFEILHRKILARMDTDVAAALTSAAPVVVNDRLAIRLKKYTMDLQTRFPTPSSTILQAAQLLAKLTYGMQLHNLVWVDLKPEQIVLTSRNTLRLVDLEDVFSVDAWVHRNGHIVRGTPFFMAPEERLALTYGQNYERKRTAADAAAIATYRLGLTLLVIATETPTFQIPDYTPQNNYEKWVDAAIIQGKAARRALASYGDGEAITTPTPSAADDSFEAVHTAVQNTLTLEGDTDTDGCDGFDLPEAFWVFVRLCIAKDPADRPTGAALAAAIAAHPTIFPASTASLVPAKLTRHTATSNHVMLAMADAVAVLPPIDAVSQVEKIYTLFSHLFERYDRAAASKLLWELIETYTEEGAAKRLLLHVDAWTTARATQFFSCI